LKCLEPVKKSGGECIPSLSSLIRLLVLALLLSLMLSGKAGKHQADHGELDHRFATLGQPLIVFGQTKAVN
jgi:hypothetical protein